MIKFQKSVTNIFCKSIARNVLYFAPTLNAKEVMKFGLIVTEDHPEKGGEEGVAKLIIGGFQEANPNTDVWTPIHAVSATLPCVEELLSYDGLCITGSHHSVNEDSQWIRVLEERLLQLRHHQNENGSDRPRIFGICFGHQLLAKAFGGRIGRMPHGQFIWGSEKVNLTRDISESEYFSQSFPCGQSDITIMQSHEECVLEMPNDAELVGTSDTCEVEVLKYGKSILSFQGHPEIKLNHMKDVNLPRIIQKGVLTEDQLKKATENLTAADTTSLTQMLIRFLRG